MVFAHAASPGNPVHACHRPDVPSEPNPLLARESCWKKRVGKSGKLEDVAKAAGGREEERGWYQLHVEVLAHVSMGLSLKEACRASQVCSSWRQAVNLSARMTSVLNLTVLDCPWRMDSLSSLFSRYCCLQELYLSTEMLLPLDAVRAISKNLGSSLKCLAGFLVSNCVEGLQPAVSEVAKISTLEELTLEGTLLTGQSLLELCDQCPKLRRLSCHEILATSSQLRTALATRPSLAVLAGVNLSVHNELDGVAQEPAGPILTQLGKLSSLGINLFTESDDSVLRSVGQLTSQCLTSLGLRACQFSASAMRDALAPARYLHTLSLVAWEDGAAVDNFLCSLQPCHLPALRSLDLDEDQVSDRGLAALAALPLAGQLTSLECLDVVVAKPATFDALLSSLSSVLRLRIGVCPLSPWLDRRRCAAGAAAAGGGWGGEGQRGPVTLAFPRMGRPGSLAKLESFSVCWCGERSWGGKLSASPISIEGLGALPALSRLELSDWPLMSEPATAAFAAKASSLRHFALSLPQDISKEALSALARGCSALEHLCLILFLDAMPPARSPYEAYLEEIRSDFARLRPACRCFIDIH